jgi:hypothetical protein
MADMGDEKTAQDRFVLENARIEQELFARIDDDDYGFLSDAVVTTTRRE